MDRQPTTLLPLAAATAEVQDRTGTVTDSDLGRTTAEVPAEDATTATTATARGAALRPTTRGAQDRAETNVAIPDVRAEGTAAAEATEGVEEDHRMVDRTTGLTTRLSAAATGGWTSAVSLACSFSLRAREIGVFVEDAVLSRRLCARNAVSTIHSPLDGASHTMRSQEDA